MPKMRFVLLQSGDRLQFVEMPSSHAYQLTALHQRLHKEIGKLTAERVPELPVAVAEFDNLELTSDRCRTVSGLEYMSELERSFSAINEKNYPLISLLTEIRALLAQLEQWYEEEQEA